MITRSINLKIPSQLVAKPHLLPLSKYRAIPNIDPNDYLVPIPTTLASQASWSQLRRNLRNAQSL